MISDLEIINIIYLIYLFDIIYNNIIELYNVPLYYFYLILIKQYFYCIDTYEYKFNIIIFIKILKYKKSKYSYLSNILNNINI